MLAALAVVGIGPGMRTVICGPMYHTAPNVHALLAGRVGGLVVLQPRLTLREIGRELYLSLNTVKTHTHSIYRKLGVSSRADAVKAADARFGHGDSPG
jgi:hypothetical protein